MKAWIRRWGPQSFAALAVMGTLWVTQETVGFVACIAKYNAGYPQSDPGFLRGIFVRDMFCTFKTFDAHNGTLVAIFTLALWLTTRATLTHVQRSSQCELRAYLGLNPTGDALGTAKIVLTPGKPFETTLAINNFGQTPGRNVRAKGWCKVMPTELGANASFPDGTKSLSLKSMMSAYPGKGGRLFHCFYSDENATAETIAAVTAGTSVRLYVYGRIDYDDVFGEAQFTNFCLVYNTSEFPGGWTISDQHGEAS